MNERKDENQTRKTYSEYFKAYGGGKFKNLDGGFTWKTSVRFIFCSQETLNGNQNNWIYDMSTRGLLIEILFHVYNVQQADVIFGFLFTFITHKLWKHLVECFTIS